MEHNNTYGDPGWVLAGKILRMTDDESIKCFGYPSPSLVPVYLSQKTAYEKYKIYTELQQTFHVGDEIEEIDTDKKYIVLSVSVGYYGTPFLGVYDIDNGNVEMRPTKLNDHDIFRKTGKHSDHLEQAMKELNKK